MKKELFKSNSNSINILKKYYNNTKNVFKILKIVNYFDLDDNFLSILENL